MKFKVGDIVEFTGNDTLVGCTGIIKAVYRRGSFVAIKEGEPVVADKDCYKVNWNEQQNTPKLIPEEELEGVINEV